jgi:hypothetical protein
MVKDCTNKDTIITRTCAGQFNSTPTFETFYKVPPNTILSQNYGLQELYENPILFLTYDFSVSLSEKGNWWKEEPLVRGIVQKKYCYSCPPENPGDPSPWGCGLGDIGTRCSSEINCQTPHGCSGIGNTPK